MDENETERESLLRDGQLVGTPQSKSPHNQPLDTEPPTDAKAAEETQAAAESLRKSQRARKLTEKAQELYENKIKKHQQRFTTTYEKWKVVAKEAKKVLGKSADREILQDLITQMLALSADVKRAYEDLRQYTLPDSETRRRVDTCHAVSEKINESASTHLQEKDRNSGPHEEQVTRSENCSVFSSAKSQNSQSRSSSSSKFKHSSLSSARKQDAAAELAANQAALRVLDEIDYERKKLEALEAEDRQRIALQEAENAARRNALEEKRREITRLETVKTMNAAKARLQVYEQEVSSDDDISELLRDSMPVQFKRESRSKYPTAQHVADPHNATQGRPAAGSDSRDTTTALAEAIAESINVSRLPVPEPSVFTGDPLRYKDWKMSFQTLIGRKNIPVNEKVYYLRKYVGGAARKAVELFPARYRCCLPFSMGHP